MGEGKGGLEMEVEVGEIVMEIYDIEMLGLNGGGRMLDMGLWGDVGIISRKVLEECIGCSKEEEGEFNM